MLLIVATKKFQHLGRGENSFSAIGPKNRPIVVRSVDICTTVNIRKPDCPFLSDFILVRLSNGPKLGKTAAILPSLSSHLVLAIRKLDK
jgi:hypothetical protein